MGDISSTTINYIENILLVKGLKHNLLSISQLCDKRYKVIFEASHYVVIDKLSNEVKFFDKRHKNVYTIDLHEVSNNDICSVANVNDNTGFWH